MLEWVLAAGSVAGGAVAVATVWVRKQKQRSDEDQLSQAFERYNGQR
ncbi:MAG: hypothetical protein AB1540_05055 [Bdellovibrionota bacterium]